MLETMSEDYVRTARAKGLRGAPVVVKHGLRAALTPILTIFGLDLGLLLGGAVLTETRFSLNGLGKYAIDGINDKDLPEGPRRDPARRLLHLLANLIVDLLYARRRPESADRVTAHRPRRSGRPAASAVPRRARPAGPLPDRRRPGQVRRRAVLPAGAGQDARHRGRVRLRQVRHQPVGILGLHKRRQRPDHAARSCSTASELISASTETSASCAASEMAMIFQDPLSAMHPYYTVGNQIIEAYRIHNDVSARRPAQHAIEMLDRVGIPAAGPRASTTTRTSSPAACASAR